MRLDRQSSGASTSFLAAVASRFSAAGAGLNSGGVHVRAGTGVDATLWVFLLASIPAWCTRAWMTGMQVIAGHGDTPVTGWQGGLLETLGLLPGSAGPVAATAAGFVYLLPLLLVAVLVSLFWAGVFATVRKRSIDAGWLLAAWLYVLLLPADLPPVLAALGMSFGCVIGSQVFGGTGYYVASPAAVGVLFVQFSYPGAAALGIDAGWASAVAGEPVSGNAAMFAASALGALALWRAGIASAGTLLGAVLGVGVAATVASTAADSAIADMSVIDHLMLGSLPLCLAFLLTDPTTASLTRGGRWLHGALFGLLVVAIRVLDPQHPDGALFAVLLAGLCVPLLDYVVIRRHTKAAGGQLELK